MCFFSNYDDDDDDGDGDGDGDIFAALPSALVHGMVPFLRQRTSMSRLSETVLTVHMP